MKQQKNFTLLVIICLLPLVLSYNACTKNKFTSLSSKMEGSGTVVGNPKITTGERIASSVCEVIHRCNPDVPVDQCIEKFIATPGVYLPLGLTSSYPTLLSVIQSEQKNILVSNSSLVDQCSSSIIQLECSNPLVQKSYQASQQNPFSGAINMISGQTCGSAVASVAAYQCSSKVFLRGVNNAVIKPKASSIDLTYSITPGLPDGLVLNSTTGEISGNPVSVTPLSSYTITATSPMGVTTSSINIKTADGYLVNDNSDSHNVGPGCISSGGSCTLRAALESTNPSYATKVIVLPKGQIDLTLNEELLLSSSSEIYGDCESGTIIDGKNTTRVFHVTAGPSKLQNLTLQNGASTQAGAGLLIDSSVSAFNLDLSDVTVQSNTSSGPTGGGAGIEVDDLGTGNSVTVSLNRCKIQNNASTQSLGGGLEIGGTAVVNMKDSIIQYNVALIGGGMNVNGTANITQSLFQKNSASTGPGGAIYCASSASGSRQVNLTNSTITDNSADRGGGIVFANNGIINVVNSTIVNNSSVSATYGGGITSNGGGGSLLLKNSIIAKNQSAGVALNCGSNVTIQSQGYNLSDQNDCGLNAVGDMNNIDPLLGSLQNNGGFSNTMALLFGSPAINAIPNSMNCPSVDQRGADRTSGGSCDIGSFEVQ
ncbi:MAG: choice-of-anchor Q domain-containing protein [Bdellovibrio sp.]